MILQLLKLFEELYALFNDDQDLLSPINIGFSFILTRNHKRCTAEYTIVLRTIKYKHFYPIKLLHMS